MPEDLGDLPEPTVEPPERFPGGVDALDDEDKYGDIPDEPLTPDLPTSSNPATDDDVPDELTEPEQGEQEPRSDGASDLGEEHPV